MTITQKAPNLAHASTEIPGVGKFTEGYDGKVAWRHIPGQGTSEVTGEELARKLRDWSFYTQMLWGPRYPWSLGLRYEYASGSGESQRRSSTRAPPSIRRAARSDSRTPFA